MSNKCNGQTFSKKNILSFNIYYRDGVTPDLIVKNIKVSFASTKQLVI